MEFFSNFKWAVPAAFSDAVSLCCFEEGDTFYDSRTAYEKDWPIARREIEYSIQVRFPARATSHVTQEGESVFDSNWGSIVKVDLYEKLNKIKSITTTQGKLYSVLWKGDVQLLDSLRSPAKPIKLKKIMSKLDEIKPHLSNYSKGYRLFILPRDSSTTLSKKKFSKVYSSLSNHLYSEPELLSPKEAGFEKWEQFAPTIDLAVFRLTSLNENELLELVKSAVYVPSRSAKKSMFRLASHGMIL
jgi:hypothetical protein